MRRAAITRTTQYSAKHTTQQPTPAPGQITSAQVWRQLSASQQQALRRTLTNICRSLADQVANEEVHDDQS